MAITVQELINELQKVPSPTNTTVTMPAASDTAAEVAAKVAALSQQVSPTTLDTDEFTIDLTV